MTRALPATGRGPTPPADPGGDRVAAVAATATAALFGVLFAQPDHRAAASRRRRVPGRTVAVSACRRPAPRRHWSPPTAAPDASARRAATPAPAHAPPPAPAVPRPSSRRRSRPPGPPAAATSRRGRRDHSPRRAGSPWPALGSTAVLVVADPAALDTARQVMADELAAIDAACSRFRPDSEISLLHAGARQPPVDGRAAARRGRRGRAAGRGADRRRRRPDGRRGRRRAGLRPRLRRGPRRTDPPSARRGPRPAGGGWGGTPSAGSLLVPRGVWLDLGATAKALAADRIAARAAAASRAAACSSASAATSRSPERRPTGAGASGSATTTSRPRRPDVDRHDHRGRAGHLRDHPTAVATRRADRAPHRRPAHRRRRRARAGGRPRVAAGTCVDANTASTAAIVMGAAAPGLARRARAAGPARRRRRDRHARSRAGPRTRSADGPDPLVRQPRLRAGRARCC